MLDSFFTIRTIFSMLIQAFGVCMYFKCVQMFAK